MKKRIESNEIDLTEVIIKIWDNKFKITAITIVFTIFSTVLFTIFKPAYLAKTEILPINIFKSNLYSSYNLLLASQPVNDNEKNLSQLILSPISKDYLLNLYIEELQVKEITMKAIKKYQLIDQKKFSSEGKYLEQVEKKALTLDLLEPINLDNNKKIQDRSNWTINFEVYDKEKWEEALAYIENEINKIIRKYLKQNFDKTIDDLKLLTKFKIEDLDLKIKNVKNDYDTETSNRLAFLSEQALIARKLNIENNTLEVENFSTPSGVISNLQTGKPYYMRGYSMIEKEIELIKTRTDKNAFTKNLFELKKQRRDLLENKLLKRIEELFNSTPIINDNNFKAANIIYQNTKYENSFSLINAISIAGFFGILFGIIYVMISSAILNRN